MHAGQKTTPGKHQWMKDACRAAPREPRPCATVLEQFYDVLRSCLEQLQASMHACMCAMSEKDANSCSSTHRRVPSTQIRTLLCQRSCLVTATMGAGQSCLTRPAGSNQPGHKASPSKPGVWPLTTAPNDDQRCGHTHTRMPSTAPSPRHKE